MATFRTFGQRADTRAATAAAVADVVARDREARRQEAAAEIEAAAVRLAEAGGVRGLSRRDYEAEKKAMLVRLRRSK